MKHTYFVSYSAATDQGSLFGRATISGEFLVSDMDGICKIEQTLREIHPEFNSVIVLYWRRFEIPE